ncbi:hypothetical protein NL676_003689 [Syzygium grande]|nr:hypothetical protein NL676_003689 [Syzygium grande]
MSPFVRALLLFLLLSCAQSKYIAYNTTSRVVPGKLNVHLVPHTHDDVGWKKTVDQYFVSSNNTIQNELDSIVPALLANKNCKFIYAEQAFFQRWWRDQSEQVQSTVKQLVNSGQLEFINGGMCMHYKATTHYIDMIDQTTLGHRFIKEEFGVTPRIGWQIDTFGHSSVQAYLLGAEVGFDSVFFARIDYQDRAKWKAEKTLEVIFAGAFPENHGPPNNFHYEVNDDWLDDLAIVQDDYNLFDYSVLERVNEFVSAAISQDGQVDALYSTPSIYTDAKHAYNDQWPLKTGNFLRYADKINVYWTGYFTSRAALKGYVRMLSGYYLAARQLEFLTGRKKLGPNTDSLADALTIAQHHDAVTGTERQHVADDYTKRLSASYIEIVSEDASVQDSSGRAVQSQLLPIMNVTLGIRNYYTLITRVYKKKEHVEVEFTVGPIPIDDNIGKEVVTQIRTTINNNKTFYIDSNGCDFLKRPLQELEDGNVLLRLAHLYEIGEDKDLSVMANVELKKLFPDKKINRMVELNLFANQEKADMLKRRLVWKVEGSPEGANPVSGGPVDPIELAVELAPMEIRTFVLNFGS